MAEVWISYGVMRLAQGLPTAPQYTTVRTIEVSVPEGTDVRLVGLDGVVRDPQGNAIAQVAPSGQGYAAPNAASPAPSTPLEPPPPIAIRFHVPGA